MTIALQWARLFPSLRITGQPLLALALRTSKLRPGPSGKQPLNLNPMWNGCLITSQVMLHLTEYLHSINYLPLTSNFKVFCRLGSWEDIVVPGSETPNKGSSLVKFCVETGIKAWWQDSQAKFSSNLGSGVGILPTCPPDLLISADP